jgi:hypothetical protein
LILLRIMNRLQNQRRKALALGDNLTALETSG